MEVRRTIFVFLLITATAPVQAQRSKQYFIGYNSLNEIYAGVDFPGKAVNKVSFQAGYQFALSKDATYKGSSSWWVANNLYGLRVRVGYQIPFEGKRSHTAFYLEYQNLQSNTFIDSSLSFPEFTEAHTKIGLRVSSAHELGKSNIFFTYSVAIFSLQVHRTYVQSDPGNYKPDEEFRATNYQFTIGLKAYLF